MTKDNENFQLKAMRLALQCSFLTNAAAMLRACHVMQRTRADLMSGIRVPAEGVFILTQGVPLSHGNLAASLRNIAVTYELGPGDRSLLVMPLFHVHGLMAGAMRPRFTRVKITVRSASPLRDTTVGGRVRPQEGWVQGQTGDLGVILHGIGPLAMVL